MNFLHFKTVAIIICALWAGPLDAQFCGTTAPQFTTTYKSISQGERIKQKSFSNLEFGITFHIVESISGDGGVTTDQLIEEIDGVNNLFFDTGIQFFTCGSQRFIQGLNSYDFESGDQLNRANHVLNTINVYLVNELTTGNLNALCGYAKFPGNGQLTQRYVVVQKSCISGGKVLSHEIGHYFGLYHTHETMFGLEWADGSNCRSAGDLLCDTRADYNLSRGGISKCSYTGEYVDPRGGPYNPNPSNIMSYAPFECLRLFSSQQREIIQFYAQEIQEELKNDCTNFVDFSILSSSPVPSIISGEKIAIQLSMEGRGIIKDERVSMFVYLSDNQEALGTIITRNEVIFKTKNPTFNQSFLIEFPLTRGSGTYTMTVVLDADFQYLESDKANNQIKIPLTVDNSLLGDIVLYPNPTGEQIKFFIRDKRAEGKFSIRFSDLNGRLLQESKGFKNEVEFLNEFDVSMLPKGVIFVSVAFTLGNTFTFTFIKS